MGNYYVKKLKYNLRSRLKTIVNKELTEVILFNFESFFIRKEPKSSKKKIGSRGRKGEK